MVKLPESTAAAQDLHADRMEGAEPRHALDHLTHHQADAALHLARRLVGEGDRQDLVRPRPPRGENVRDARGQHARFAGAGPGQHQHRPVQRLDRLPLLGIKVSEIGAPAACKAPAAMPPALGVGGNVSSLRGSGSGMGSSDQANLTPKMASPAVNREVQGTFLLSSPRMRRLTEEKRKTPAWAGIFQCSIDLPACRTPVPRRHRCAPVEPPDQLAHGLHIRMDALGEGGRADEAAERGGGR